MVHIPQHIQELVSYKPGKPVDQIIQELNLTETAILWNNENNLGSAPKALERVKEALDSSHLYPDPAATQLCERIAKLNDCSVDHVSVDNGSESILDAMFRAFFQNDDELITCEGTFVAVYIWAKSNNIPCEKYPLKRGYQFDVDRLIGAVTPNTKAVYVANPNNPTGAMISKQDLEQLIHSVPEHVLVIVDEAYYEYAKEIDEGYPDSFAMRQPNVITLRTFSKAYGIAGIRVGYALGEPKLIEAIRKVRMTFAPGNLAQAAAIGAIEDQDHVKKSVRLNRKSLSEFYIAMHEQELDYIPSYGNFVMVDLKSEESALQFVNDLLKKGVFIRHLRAFGLPHCVRISTGTQQENALLVRSLSDGLY
ncbi:MAG: histidinol-phosphate transaminase [Salibacteraceae bacterium]